MTDPIPPDSQPGPETPIIATRVKFCPQCGNPLGVDSPCLFCNSNPPAFAVDSTEHKKNHSALRHVIVFYCSMLATSIFFRILAALSGIHESLFRLELFSTIVFSTIIFIFACVHVKSLFGQIFRKFNPEWILIAAIMAMGTSLVAHILVSLFVRFGVQSQSYIDTYQDVPHGMLWCIVLICVQPAIFEEIAFRGVIHTSLRSFLSNRETIFVVGFMFAILHLSVVSVPHLALMGIALGFLRVKTGSLIPGMTLHFLHNLFIIGIEKFGGSFS